MASAARAYNSKFYVPPKSKPSSKRNRRKQVVHKSAFMIIILLTLVTLTKLVQEVLHAQVLTSINQYKAGIEKAGKRRENLEFRLGQMQAPGRIKSIAVNKLGMVEARKAGYIMIPNETNKAQKVAARKSQPKLASTLGSVLP